MVAHTPDNERLRAQYEREIVDQIPWTQCGEWEEVQTAWAYIDVLLDLINDIDHVGRVALTGLQEDA
jgi:hypothetical protein